MDLAIYISELLGFKGEVNVPGLGYFVQKRVSGYYNDREGKFYPPSHEIIFSPTATDDNSLANYITLKKNISQASAKYFIEKYVTGVKQQASNGKADIAGLGYLYYEYAALAFKADAALGTDPGVYGLKPIKASRVGDQPVVKTSEPVVPEVPPVIENEEPAEEIPVVPEGETITDEAVVPPPTIITEDDAVQEEEQDYTVPDDDEVKRSPWIVVLTMVIIALLALTGIYLYDPTLIGLKRKTDSTTIIVKKGPPPVVQTADSTAKKDTISKAAAPASTIQPAVDTFAVKHYDVSGGTFKSLANFDKAFKTYAALGLHPQIAKQVGQHLIILATFFSYDEAKRAKDSILNIKGITKTRIFIQTYIPKK